MGSGGSTGNFARNLLLVSCLAGRGREEDNTQSGFWTEKAVWCPMLVIDLGCVGVEGVIESGCAAVHLSGMSLGCLTVKFASMLGWVSCLGWCAPEWDSI